jgi:hypothetical protein
MGLPLSPEAMQRRVWMDSWFYPTAAVP